MATKKKLLQAAAGSAGGAGALNVEDVFSTYLYEGNGESQSIDNGINLGQSNDGGSAHFEPDDSNDTDEISLASANYITSGDFTVECFVWIEGLNSTNTNGYEIPTIFYFNSPRLSLTYDFVSPGGSADQAFNLFDTTYRFGSVNQHPEATYTNTWVHVAVVRNSGTIRCYVDGTEAFNFSNTTDYSGATLTIGNNSNGTPVQGHISNFRVVDGTALYTSNFTPPTSELTAVSGTTLLTFTSEDTLTDTSSNSHDFTITGSVSASTFGPFDAAEAGEGGLVWIKNRSTSASHALVDTERGREYYLHSDETSAQRGPSSSGRDVASFNSNGFSLGSLQFENINVSSNDYASWTFRKAPKFFDVVTYTGDGSTSRQISHNLGSVPGCIIIKRTDAAAGWPVFHRSLGHVDGTPNLLFLNVTNAAGSSTLWDNTAPTSSTFNIDDSSTANASGGTYVAYLFAHNDGDGGFGPDGDADIIKCGSYTGNGTTTGPVIDLGFEPQWLLIKNATVSNEWPILDNMRGIVSGGNDNRVWANLNSAENTGDPQVKLLPNGFQPESASGSVNQSGQTFIYIAIRRGPMAVPTDATDVFYVDTVAASSSSSTGFDPDMWIRGSRDGSGGTNSQLNMARLIDGKYLATTQTSAEIGTNAPFGDGPSNQFTNTVQGGSGVNWFWKRAPSYFDVVAYTGNGTAGLTVSHNLGVAPEMIWIKRRDATGNWMVLFNMDGSSSDDMVLEGINILNTRSYPNTFLNSSPTSTEIVLGSNPDVNNSSTSTHIAYLFASLDGISKVGSYTGNGTSQTIDCGFSSGARFVLIKRTDSTSDWWVFDTARGIVAGNDGLLALNGNATEGASYDNIDPDSSGFIINNTAWNENASGGTYIFYAIA